MLVYFSSIIIYYRFHPVNSLASRACLPIRTSCGPGVNYIIRQEAVTSSMSLLTGWDLSVYRSAAQRVPPRCLEPTTTTVETIFNFFFGVCFHR